MMDKKIIFIFGCQRSGTTATADLFKGEENFKVFEEIGEQIHRMGKYLVIRLKQIDALAVVLNNYNEKYLVVRPLVESQNAEELLNAFPNSVGIWMYRDYLAVISSMIKKWGGNVGNEMLKNIKDKERNNWRTDKINDETAKFVMSLLNNLNLSEVDSSAMFWYLRNMQFYRQKLQNHKRIRLVKYDLLVSDSSYLNSKLDSLGTGISLDKHNFHKNSLQKGRNLILHPIVDQLCKNLWDRMNNDHDTNKMKSPN